MKTRGWKAAVVAAVVVLGAAACTDTTVEPKSSITTANAFNDPSSYKALLAKVYGGLVVTGQQGPSGNADLGQFDEGFSQYVRLLWESQELPTDEAVIGWNDTGLPALNTQLWDATNGFLNILYYRVYYQIALANEFLRQTTDDQLNSRGVSADLKTQIKQYRAEVRFLRALSYWHGIDSFGNIPLIKETDNFGATLPTQSSRSDVYNFIVAELTAIKPDLPASTAANYGRATTGAASMLLAKLYLNAAVYTGTANYAGAISALNDVIGGGFTLDANYRHMFMADNNTSPEIIFAIPQDGVHTQTWGGLTFLIHASCGGNMSNADYGIDGCWWGLRLKPEAYQNFTAADKRASFFFTNGQTPAISDYTNFNQGIAAPKFTNKTSSGAGGQRTDFPDTDYPMFRLGDAYLMYAEAVLRGGGGSRATALGYVNALRARANVPAWADSDLTLDNILAERGRELLWEGHRRTDLVRFGKFAGGSTQGIWALKGGVPAGKATDAHLNLYPLPGTEVVANPNLHQNPGY